MRNELLYVGANNKLVDMDDSTNITLKYKNNIFTDIGKIVSNTSYTIKLPNTVRNQSAFLHADLPSCQYSVASFYLDARYIRNGVEIIKGAKIYLIGTSDVFETALIWGNATQFSSIANEEKKLQDLKERWHYESQGNDPFPDYYIEWNSGKNVSQYDSHGDFFFPKVNYNIRSADKDLPYHPAVKATWILEHISLDNDVIFIFPSEQQAVLNKLFIPLLTRNDGLEFSQKNELWLNAKYYLNQGTGPIELYFENKEYSSYYGTVNKSSLSEGTFISGIKTKGNSIKLNASGKVSIHTLTSFYPSNAAMIAYYIENGENNEIFNIGYTDIISNGGNSYNITFEFEGVESDSVNKGTDIRFGFTNIGFIADVSNGVDGIINLRMENSLVSPKQPDESILNGNGHYPIIPNLPDMTQLDFIKAISTMLGVFAYPIEGTNIIRFMSVDDIIKKKEQAYNWTRRVIASYMANKPKEMKFTIDGFAQRNILKYKDDDTVKGNYSGEITCLISSLEKSREMAELKFAGCDMRGITAFIRLYKYDGEGKAELQKVQPRILLEENNGGLSNGTFTQMSFTDIIKRFYTSFQNAVYTPKIIKEKIEITEKDLRDLDMTTPAYLAQYGKYYAILSVTAENTGIANVELLQLDI